MSHILKPIICFVITITFNLFWFPEFQVVKSLFAQASSGENDQDPYNVSLKRVAKELSGKYMEVDENRPIYAVMEYIVQRDDAFQIIQPYLAIDEKYGSIFLSYASDLEDKALFKELIIAGAKFQSGMDARIIINSPEDCDEYSYEFMEYLGSNMNDFELKNMLEIASFSTNLIRFCPSMLDYYLSRNGNIQEILREGICSLFFVSNDGAYSECMESIEKEIFAKPVAIQNHLNNVIAWIEKHKFDQKSLPTTRECVDLLNKTFENFYFDVEKYIGVEEEKPKEVVRQFTRSGVNYEKVINSSKPLRVLIDEKTAIASAKAVAWLIRNDTSFSFDFSTDRLFNKTGNTLATVAIVGMSLMTALKTHIVMDYLKTKHGYTENSVKHLLEKIRREIRFGIPILTHDSSDRENNWGRVYSLLFLLADLKSERFKDGKLEKDKKNNKLYINALVDSLEKAQGNGGGWSYLVGYPEYTHLTAPALHALAGAKYQGFSVEDKALEEAYSAICGSLLFEGEYKFAAVCYSIRNEARERVYAEGSIGRNSAAIAALFLLGQDVKEEIVGATELFIEHVQFLEKERNRGPKKYESESSWHNRDNYRIAPYYFSYGFAYTLSALELIDNAKTDFRAAILTSLLKVQNSDGSFSEKLDNKTKNYPTALALLALLAPVDTPLTPDPRQ